MTSLSLPLSGFERKEGRGDRFQFPVNYPSLGSFLNSLEKLLLARVLEYILTTNAIHRRVEIG